MLLTSVVVPSAANRVMASAEMMPAVMIAWICGLILSFRGSAS